MPPYLSVVRSLALLPILALPTRERKTHAEQSVHASGFVVKFGDTPERLAVSRSLPANKSVARTRGGKTYFVYAEPNGCVCAFVGTPEAYARYPQWGAAPGVGDRVPSAPHLVDQMMDDIRPADAADPPRWITFSATPPIAALWPGGFGCRRQ